MGVVKHTPYRFVIMLGKLKHFLVLTLPLLAGLTFIQCEDSPSPKTPGGGQAAEDEDKDPRGNTDRSKNPKDDKKKGGGSSDRDTGLFIDDDDIPVGAEGQRCEDDSDCEDDVCEDYFDNDRNCKQLPRRRALSLLISLENLAEAKFDKVRHEDMGLALAIDESFWIDLIDNDYSASDAKKALKWLVETEKLLHLFLQIDEGDFSETLMWLFLKADRAPEYYYKDESRNNVWNVWDPIQNPIKRNLNFLALVLDENPDSTEDFVRFMHEYIVEDIVCRQGVRPFPSTLSIRGVSRYSRAEAALARQYNKEACILGVYFVLVKDDEDRKQVADWVDDTETEFIERKQSEGGLSPEDDEIEDASEWPDEAHERLKFLWTDTEDSINLNL